jgi:type IV fimbrial biogenesis protein FimT
MISRGFSLVELLLAMAVLALLMAFGMPMYSQFIANSQIRTAGESIMTGLQLAKSEAARQNLPVEFSFEAGTDAGWTVQIARGDRMGEMLGEHKAAEGVGKVAPTFNPAGATKITFNGFGSISNNEDGSPALTHVKLDSTVLAATDSRELCVVINSGGAMRLCDPNVGSTDTRSCGNPVPAACQ